MNSFRPRWRAGKNRDALPRARRYSVVDLEQTQPDHLNAAIRIRQRVYACSNLLNILGFQIRREEIPLCKHLQSVLLHER